MEGRLIVVFQSGEGFHKQKVALLAINARSYASAVHYTKERGGLHGHFGEKKDNLPWSEKSHI